MFATRSHAPRAGLRSAPAARILLALAPAVARAFPFAPQLVAMMADEDEPDEQPGSTTFWLKLGISMCLVLMGGIFAGLTLGLMGLDELHLRVLENSSDDPKERKRASKVLRLMRMGRHWVLVVLLLGNVIVNESLPIFLDSAIGGGVAAILISTTLIVIFGEIIPQAVSVRHGLRIGAAAAPGVLCLMWLLSPIAWPTAKLLDYVLGKDEGTTYKKAELKSFLQFHRQGEEPLRDDEISILNGVLELNNKKVESIMTPMDDVVTLSADKLMDQVTIEQLFASGYSRVPVHEPGKPLSFIGLLLVKQLVTYDSSDPKPVSSLKLSILPEAQPSINCFQALDYFQTGRAHLLLISKTPGQAGGALGVVTLEDIIEEIIAEEIVDETDRVEDNRTKRRAKRMTNKAIMKGIVERHIRRASSVKEPTVSTALLSPVAGDGVPAAGPGAGYGATAARRIDDSRHNRTPSSEAGSPRSPPTPYSASQSPATGNGVGNGAR